MSRLAWEYITPKTFKEVVRPYMDQAEPVSSDPVTQETRKNLLAIREHYKQKGGE